MSRQSLLDGTRTTVMLNLGRMWTKAPAQHVAFLHVLNNEQNTSLDVHREHFPLRQWGV
jgi:hypothetical protein